MYVCIHQNIYTCIHVYINTCMLIRMQLKHLILHRTTYLCPSGAGSEKVLISLLEQEPSYKCLPLNELVFNFVTSPLVFPGDPQYDPQFFRIEMIGTKPRAMSKEN